MHVFINERSFCGQFQDRNDFTCAIVNFLKSIDSARRALGRCDGRMWRSAWLGDAHGLRDQSLHQCLNHLAGRELSDNFKSIVFDMANPAPWEPERAHKSEDLYVLELVEASERENFSLVDGEDVTDSSVAELAERKLNSTVRDGCLINIQGSPFDGKGAIDVLKVDCARVALPSHSKREEFDDWFRHNFAQVPDYGPDAIEPPRDEQTCLVDRSVYVPTARECQGRKIYCHLTNGQLYYVDNLHFGAAAHLEVFDKRGRKHLGEASLDGQIRPNTRDFDKKPIGV